MADEEVEENGISLYKEILHKLHREENNIRSVYFKLTMTKPIKLK